MARVLLVDDEPGIRATLSQILEQSGFETTSVPTVSDALSEIMSNRFDILLSDLNIGEPGDGFTVVSAMHRVNPSCRTFILTGFPAFESALQAIRAQVDDYIIKPANIPSLISLLQESMKAPPRKLPPEGKRLHRILRECRTEIINKTLATMKRDPRLNSIHLEDSQRIDHLPEVIEQLAILLESEHPENTRPEALEKARLRGRLRHSQGFSAEMLVSETRTFLRSLNEVVQENLLAVDLSHLVSDSKWLRESALLQLEESLRALHEVERELAA